MTQKTAKQIENMKNQTIGVEIEMNSITRNAAAKLAADFFGTGHWEYTAHRNGYMTWSAWDADGREWKFQRDVSIHGDDDHKCEMVTPILTYNDIETLQELCRRLRKAGARSDASRGCGVHIHIGAQGHTPQTLRNLVNLMASHENLLIDALCIDLARINSYCRTVDPQFLEEVNKRKPSTLEDLASVWYTSQDACHLQNHHYNKSRYHMLNLHATFTKGTIEFRCFNFATPNPSKNRKGGIHAGLLKTWIQLCLALSQMAKDSKTISPKQPQVENPKFAMRTWTNRMGMIGDEFKTAREFLIKNLDGNAAWRFGSVA